MFLVSVADAVMVHSMQMKNAMELLCVTIQHANACPSPSLEEEMGALKFQSKMIQIISTHYWPL